MTRHVWTHVLALLGLGLSLWGCGDAGEPTTGTHIGNPGDLEFRVSSALTAEDGSLEAADTADRRYTLREARLAVRDIELSLPDGMTCAELSVPAPARCEGADDKLRLEGPFVMDLLNQTTTPSLSGVVLPGVAWRRIDFRIADADEGELPQDDLLSERSLAMRATFEHDGAPTELQVRLRFNEDARVESPQGLIVADGGRLVVDFDAARWLASAPISECLDEGDLRVEGGVLLIDDDDSDHDCGDLEDAIKQDIKDSAILVSE